MSWAASPPRWSGSTIQRPWEPASVFAGDANEPEQLEHMLRQLPGSHMAGMETTFKPRSKE